MLWTMGHPITKLGENFNYIGSGWFLSIPTPVWIAGIVAIMGHLLLSKIKFGRYVYAVGGRFRAAQCRIEL